MFLSGLINYLRGIVSIIAEGVFPERFINLCVGNGISLWNIKRLDKNHICAEMSIGDFKKLHKINKNCRCRVRITKKHGLPFFIYRHKKRKALLGGIALFFSIVLVLTRFVWVINVTGNEKISKEKILEYAKASGLYFGVAVSSVNSDKVKDYIMTNDERIAFVGITKSGTSVSIDIRERAEKRKHFDKNAPSNIIASQSGVIESTLVQSGTALVKKGDVVCVGQLLVSGAEDSRAFGIKYSNSDAQITARVWHEKTVELPYYSTTKRPTGNEKKSFYLDFFGKNIKIFAKNKILFEKYDILSYTKYIPIGKDIVIPIGIHTEVFSEYEEIKNTLSESELKQLLTKEMDSQYKSSKIISRKFDVKDNKMTVIYECIEDIGLEEEINDNGKILGG